MQYNQERHIGKSIAYKVYKGLLVIHPGVSDNKMYCQTGILARQSNNFDQAKQ